ncbi:MAG: DNA-binding protein WhiA [Lachnospiraceae bacterium]|nr:DNA-binding protein WhiA [Lachnospiraceae bacterium]
MSFSKQVKEELARVELKTRHCNIAEISAYILCCGRIVVDEYNEYSLLLHTENELVADRFEILVRTTFGAETIRTIYYGGATHHRTIHEIIIDNPEDCVVILQATKLLDSYGNLEEHFRTIHQIVLQNTCCKRAFIRGAFLSSGSISTPDKKYHFEIVCHSFDQASQIMNVLNAFHLDAKIVKRKNNYVVYMKEGEKIVDALNIMEAHVSLMELENIRIIKDVRNKVNRKVNCETANIKKTVSAAMKQKKDIEYLIEHNAFDRLPGPLKEIASLRLEYETASLVKLGAKLDPPVGKSGVNHRMRKISQIAEDLRNSQ